MLKKIVTLFLAITFVLAALPVEQPAEAAASYTYVKENYSETTDKKGNVTTTLNSVTVMTSAGKYVNFVVDKSTIYFINNTKTTIKGFKAGMKVTVYSGSKKATKITASTNSGNGAIVANSKHILGAVTEIDPNGLYIKVKPDGGQSTIYTVNYNTNYFKEKQAVNLSSLYVGDRVRLKFASANTKTVSEVEIINAAAILVQDLYKAQLNTVNTSKNSITVKNAQPLLNWEFGTSVSNAQKTFTFTDKTSIYLGNQKISKAQLKNYRENDLYFVTSKQFNKEVVSKIVVLKNNEFTFYQPITRVTLDFNHLMLSDWRNFEYHKGSILIRNGRLIEPEGFIAMNSASSVVQTSAFVIGDGVTDPKYAHVVKITNDSLSAPNLSGHQLYFGKLDLADLNAYKLELTDVERYNNNIWKPYNGDSVFAFSNSTDATEFDGTLVFPEMELENYETRYGYFYVKDGHVQAMHFIDEENDAGFAHLTSTGRISAINQNTMTVKNASQWYEDTGEWTYLAEINVDLENVMFIRNGKVVSKNQLKPNDRVVLLMDANEHTHILIVN